MRLIETPEYPFRVPTFMGLFCTWGHRTPLEASHAGSRSAVKRRACRLLLPFAERPPEVIAGVGLEHLLGWRGAQTEKALADRG
jgi:hypothetical protein